VLGQAYQQFATRQPTPAGAPIDQGKHCARREGVADSGFGGEVGLEFNPLFALEQALAVRDDVDFFQAVRAAFAKATVPGAASQEDMDSAIRQLVSRAVASDKVIDIFAAAGLKSPALAGVTPASNSGV
jgi:hypothetical protein